ncbi:unnamed protein product [Orchesella dallaii]|uniref:Glutamate receptor ionotropic, kainate 2 n=1 Tax=Orchesella dallaii TaxID=48710 RepID=A0ABP1QTM7_9HEXA
MSQINNNFISSSINPAIGCRHHSCGHKVHQQTQNIDHQHHHHHPDQRHRRMSLIPLLLPLTLWLLATFHLETVGALPEIIRLGGLFDIEDRYEEIAYRHAVQRVDSEQILNNTRLSAHWERLPMGDSFHASKKVCQLLQEGIAVVFGPQSPQTANLVQSVCDALEVPHVETNWDFRSNRGNYMINLFPHPSNLSRVFADVVTAWGWDKYIVIYENHESLIRLQEILKESNPSSRQAFVKQLPPDDDYRPLFKEVRSQAEITSIIIDCDSSKLPKIFEHARETGMMKDRRYFLTSLDILTLDPEEFSQTDSINVTALSLIDPDRIKVKSIIEQWDDLVVNGFRNRSHSPNFYFDDSYSGRNRYRQPAPSPTEPVPNLANNMLKTETALMYDAVELVARALFALNESYPHMIHMKSLNCKTQDTWQQGHLLLDVLRKVQFEGITGNIQFDPNGFRTNLTMDIIELSKNGFSRIGIYNTSEKEEKFTWTRTATETLRQQEEDLKDKILYVTTIIGAPYSIKGEDGNFTGYVPDLIEKLASVLKFRYEIREVADGKYGGPDPITKRWNGMIGEVMSGAADMAVADLSINFDRESAVDFTMPFMNLGISILYKNPAKTPPSLFSFLEPFNPEVWIYMATAYLGVSLVLFILARITPVQWQNPHPCKDDPDELENDLGVTNALWHNWGSLMQQGSDIAPKALSTRTVAGMWWFFTLIMISSYTANLAAFLANEGMEGAIKDIKDLPGQHKVKYGCVKSGTTRRFFEFSNFPLYKEIWTNMVNMKPDPLEDRTPDGVERVKKSNGTYAFFMESTSIEYAMANDEECRLTQVGGLLDSKGYGVALRKNSRYRNAFSNTILLLAEKGELETLKKKWWKGTGHCATVGPPPGGATPLSMAHVGGVFVVLLGGCAMACVMSIIEFMWKSRKFAKNVEKHDGGRTVVTID